MAVCFCIHNRVLIPNRKFLEFHWHIGIPDLFIRALSAFFISSGGLVLFGTHLVMLCSVAFFQGKCPESSTNGDAKPKGGQYDNSRQARARLVARNGNQFPGPRRAHITTLLT